MNPWLILKNGWRITWHTGQLWALTIWMYIVLFPSLVLSGGFGALAGALTFQDDPVARRVWNFQLPQFSNGIWIMIMVGMMLVILITCAFSWMLQAASIRVVVAAAEGKKMTLRESLALGRNRILSIVKLDLTFGVLLTLIGLIPLAAMFLIPHGTAEGTMLISTLQTVLTPLNSILSIILLLVLMAIAVEDLRPRAAFGRAWTVFRGGWWGFLLVFAALFLMALSIALVLTPILFILIFIISSGWVLSVPWMYILGIGGCLVSAPLLLAFFTFNMVFSTVLYALTYHATSVSLTHDPSITHSAQSS